MRGNDGRSWDICPSATTVTQEFDCTDFDKEWKVESCSQPPNLWWHAGIDLWAVDIEGKEVHATRDGEVVTMKAPASILGKFAVCLKIQEPGRTVYLEYGHLKERMVKDGDSVTVGQVLGKVGSEGSSTAPHLHVEARLDGPNQNNQVDQAIDPEPYLRGEDMTPEEHEWLKHLVGFVDQEVGPNFQSFKETTQQVRALADEIAALKAEVASLKAQS